MPMTRAEQYCYLERLQQTIRDMMKQYPRYDRLKDPDAFDRGLFSAVEALVVCHNAME